MFCEASGKPLPDVAWIRNGVLESSGKKAAFLKFNNINRTDAGQYTCRANNSVEVTAVDTSIVVQCKYILTVIYFIYSANPVIGVSYPELTNLFKSEREPFRASSPMHTNLFSFVCIGPNYWLGQLNAVESLLMLLYLEECDIFFPSHCFSWTVFNSENGLKPFPNHCDNPEFTPFN